MPLMRLTIKGNTYTLPSELTASLTLDEWDLVEDITGCSPAEAEIELARNGSRINRALALVAMRRVKPQATAAELGGLTLEDLAWEIEEPAPANPPVPGEAEPAST